MSRKENYHEWFRKVKNTLIFIDMWDGDAIDEVDKSAPVPPTNTKELALWKSKDKKVYALIISFVSEEVDI